MEILPISTAPCSINVLREMEGMQMIGLDWPLHTAPSELAAIDLPYLILVTTVLLYGIAATQSAQSGMPSHVRSNMKSAGCAPKTNSKTPYSAASPC